MCTFRQKQSTVLFFKKSGRAMTQAAPFFCVRRNVTRRTSATTTKPLVGEICLGRQDLNNRVKTCSVKRGKTDPLAQSFHQKVSPELFGAFISSRVQRRFLCLAQTSFQLKPISPHSWPPPQVLKRYAQAINFCLTLITTSARNISVISAPPSYRF